MLCKASDPDAALVYLYLNAHSGRASLSKVSQDLHIPESRLSHAFDLLSLHGIAAPEGAVPVKEPVPADPAELLSLREGDADFNGLCNYLEVAQGRTLSRQELETLSSMYFSLGLPSDLFILMINYARSKKRFGIHTLERMAYEWHDAGIRTYSDGEAHITELEARMSREYGVMRLFGLYDRKPSDKEREYIEKWIGMGFSDEMLKRAYETMINRTHRISFPYLNGILERWHESGIKTPHAADNRDTKPATQESLETRVTAMFEKKRHERELLGQKRLQELKTRSPDFAENEKNIRLLSSSAARASGEARKRLLSERSGLIAERAAILKKLELPRDWLELRPDCPICSDYGYVGTKMCDCFKKAMAELGKK